MDLSLILAAGACWVAGTGLFLWHPDGRSLASVLFTTATLAVAGTAMALGGPAWLVTIGLLGVWSAGLWDLNDILSPMPRVDRRFDRQARAIRLAVAASAKALTVDDWEGTASRHAAELNTLLEQTHALESPDTRWEELRLAMIRALEFDREVFEARRPTTGPTGNASAARWEAIDRMWTEIRRERSQPWRLTL